MGFTKNQNNAIIREEAISIILRLDDEKVKMFLKEVKNDRN